MIEYMQSSNICSHRIYAVIEYMQSSNIFNSIMCIVKIDHTFVLVPQNYINYK
jgi:hypothetical protein